MYTIKEASSRSGVPVATIRAWERRYRAVEPARTASGYRLYDDEAVDRLLAMRHLVEVEGIRPNQAAEQIRGGGDAVRALADRARAHPAETDGSVATAAPAEERAAIDAFRDAVRRLDIGALEVVLDEVLATQRFERAVGSVIFPALRAVGDDWASGEIDVAQEHAASETVRRRLARAFDAAAGPTSGVDVVVGLPPGRHHELAVLAFAVAARRAGLRVLYLGADVPVASWVAAVRATSARAAVLGAIGREDVRPTRAVVEALAASSSGTTAAVGGRSAATVADGADVVVLPDAIDAAVEQVRAIVQPAV